MFRADMIENMKKELTSYITASELNPTSRKLFGDEGAENRIRRQIEAHTNFFDRRADDIKEKVMGLWSERDYAKKEPLFYLRYCTKRDELGAYRVEVAHNTASYQNSWNKPYAQINRASYLNKNNVSATIMFSDGVVLAEDYIKRLMELEMLRTLE